MGGCAAQCPHQIRRLGHVTRATMPATTRTAIHRLISLTAQHPACPCHRCSAPAPAALSQLRQFATPVHAVQKEYAFEVRPTHHSPLFADRPQGRRIQPQVRRGRHPRGWHGPQEHESAQGNSHPHSLPSLHFCAPRSASSRTPPWPSSSQWLS